MYKKIVILLILATAAYRFFSSYESEAPIRKTPAKAVSEFSPAQPRNIVFKCDGRQHCSQMRSYEEAVFFLNNCPNTKMDGDNDGVPCERQF